MEKQGVRLHERYPRILGAFGAWLGLGASILLFATEHWILGAFLMLGAAISAVVAIRGSRMSEKVFTQADMFVQWILLLMPVGFVLAMLLVLGRFFFPIVGYFAGYALILIVIAVLAGRELRRGVPSNQHTEVPSKGQ